MAGLGELPDVRQAFPLKDGLHRSPDRIMNRNPGMVSTQYSRSRAVQSRPQVLPEANETGTNWTPYGMFVTHPYEVPMPYSLMSQAQAHLYDSAVGMWPAAAQADYPNGQQAGPLIRLAPTTSAHPGFANPTGANPTMVFFSPPVFSYQTKPIYATGL
jgi:hypothetical protein